MKVFSDAHTVPALQKVVGYLAEDELVFCCGDLGTDSEDVRKFIEETDLFHTYNIYTIYGNHDNVDFIRKLPGFLETGVHLVEGLKVLAINGNYARDLRQKHQVSPALLQEQLKPETVDLVLTHEPPFGIRFGESNMRIWQHYYIAITQKILSFTPRFWFYGHINQPRPDQLVQVLGKTMCVGVPRKLVEVNSSVKLVVDFTELAHYGMRLP